MSRRHPERPDHILLELDFMSLLVGLERQAENSFTALREQRRSIAEMPWHGFCASTCAW